MIKFYEKKDKYFEFSNYYESPVIIKGLTYPSVEHYYQASKFNDEWYKNIIIKSSTPNKARVLANQETGGGYKWRTDLNEVIKESKEKGVKMRKDWDEMKLWFMMLGVLNKFKNNEKLKALLLSTENKKIIEDSPRDNYWGIGKDGKGENMLGRVLMCVRKLLSATEVLQKKKDGKEAKEVENNIKEDVLLPPTSNWLIKNKIIMGAYPDPDSKYAEQLVKLGVTTFISLQTKEELKKFRSYKEQAINKAKNINKKVEFINFPIEDRKITDDKETIKFVKFIIDEKLSKLKEGDMIFIHCYGGKGRTGIITALILSWYYKMSYQEVIDMLEEKFQTRCNKGGKGKMSCPQTKEQFKQVERLAYKKEYKDNKTKDTLVKETKSVCIKVGTYVN